MTRDEFISVLRNAPDIIPYEHDASYGLIRKIIEQYSHLKSNNPTQYNNLNGWDTILLVKASTIHRPLRDIINTYRFYRILDNTNLDENEKAILRSYYNDNCANLSEMGMFTDDNRGYDSCIRRNSNNPAVVVFFDLLISLLNVSANNFNYRDLNNRIENIRLLGVARISQILHCLRPEIFPVLNGATCKYLDQLNITLDASNLDNYLTNCENIVRFKQDNNLTFSNYRTMDKLIYDNLNQSSQNTVTPLIPSVNTNTNAEQIDDMCDGATIIPKNIILYGPPGTGKTYNTTYYALAIIEGQGKDLQEKYEYIKAKYEIESAKAKLEEYRQARRVQFTTFHQSYGYEEFIEGIKPDVDEQDGINYQIVDGVFKKFCQRATNSQLLSKSIKERLDPNNLTPTVWKVSLKGTGDNEIRKDCLNNNYIRIGFDSYGEHITDQTDFSKEGGKNVLDAFINKMQIGDLVVSCWSAYETDAIGIVRGEYEWNSSFRSYKRVRNVEWLAKGIQSIKDLNNNTAMTLASVYKLRIDANDILRLAEKINSAQGDIKIEQNQAVSTLPCVFVIDEINRGHVSKIFGELITLIEDSKRKGEPDEISAILPYSGKPFSVPSNVYILGTMNTADRSLAMLDTALRRRFDFVEMMPRYEDKFIQQTIRGIDLARLLTVINKRISVLLDREHQIGHAFFVHVKDFYSLKKVFKNKILPLLQEYFYDDYSKIRLVLGDVNKKNQDLQFVKQSRETLQDIFGSDDVDIDLENSGYEINDDAFEKPDAYIGIYDANAVNTQQQTTQSVNTQQQSPNTPTDE